MWISRKFYELLAAAQAEARAQAETIASLKTTNDWARLRITQLEKERAQLIYATSGAKIAVPEFVQEPGNAAGGNFLHDMPGFDDIGDDMAAKLGIGWGKDGRVEYQSPPEKE